MYRDGRGDESGRDGVGVAFAVGGVKEPDGGNLEAHLRWRLAWMAVAALELYRLDADREREVARGEVAVVLSSFAALLDIFHTTNSDLAPLCERDVTSCCIPLSPPGNPLRRPTLVCCRSPWPDRLKKAPASLAARP